MAPAPAASSGELLMGLLLPLLTTCLLGSQQSSASCVCVCIPRSRVRVPPPVTCITAQRDMRSKNTPPCPFFPVHAANLIGTRGSSQRAGTTWPTGPGSCPSRLLSRAALLSAAAWPSAHGCWCTQPTQVNDQTQQTDIHTGYLLCFVAPSTKGTLKPPACVCVWLAQPHTGAGEPLTTV